MTERHPDGFLTASRRDIGYRDPRTRVLDFREIYAPRWQEDHVRTQGRRCTDCGVPTCMGGCPIGNLIPEWNDLVSRGRWREALERLHATNNFPEFTGYTCPAPCEPACVLELGDRAVTIKSIERAIVDRGWEAGWIRPEPPVSRTPYKVAVVGSGPAGLAAAQQLNRAGHRVTVYERDDAPGGLMTYGIPDFKFAKFRVRRRIDQLAREGVTFRTRVNVGTDVSLDALRRAHDAVCLAIGALVQRDLTIPGRGLAGVELAMPFLTQENRRQAGRAVAGRSISAEGRRVVVLGGGDTADDCVATALRQGAAQVERADINLIRPRRRPPDNPWPEPPITFRQTYATDEGSATRYGFEALEFEAGADGRVTAVIGQRVSWTYTARRRRIERRIIAPFERLPCDLALIATGFTGPEVAPVDSRIQTRPDGTIAAGEDMQTRLDGVFAAGDANLGASIVVWAIGEGRDVARAIDTYLTGGSHLPGSLRTPNPPTEWDLDDGRRDT